MKRYYYIDNLRVVSIMLVVMLHLAVTYSNLGLWYYNEKQALGFFSYIYFGLFQTFLQGYLMGILFLVAGYFTPGALDKKGFSRFIADRWKRLGLPSLFYVLFVTPLILWAEVPSSPWTGGASSFLQFYGTYIMSGGMHFLGIGPMWFAVALLIFSVIYGVVRTMGKGGTEKKQERTLSQGIVLPVLILVVAAGAFLIRLVFPVGTIYLGMQLCYFSQYIILFVAGILAYRTNFFGRVTSSTGTKWLSAGMIIGFCGLFVMKWIAGVYDFATRTIHPVTGPGGFGGGVSWKSIVFPLWESFVAVAMTVGLLAFFRDKGNYYTRLTERLSDSAFAVYMFHPPIIIAVTLALRHLEIEPAVKWALASVISVPLCFFLAYYVLLRVPLLKKIL